MYKALEITVSGRVQGVGFRPFLYSLAKQYQLTGIVQNNFGSVFIHIEGNEPNLLQMVTDIKREAPPLSKISDLQVQAVSPIHYKDFTIVPSEKSSNSLPLVSSDAAICDKCMEEWRDPENRRFHHPFINCTQCGPRYTIIQDLPYDRIHTTMKDFQMCPECQKEYEDPSNRRHHAQPICCPSCGPKLTLYDCNNKQIADRQDAVTKAIDFLAEGKIVAIKGIGGYHLACDAYQGASIKELRVRKGRPQKPLAVMAKSIETVQRLCNLSKEEEKMLTGTEKPIVVLTERKVDSLPESLSPELTSVGVMLPYTPLHHLLFEGGKLDCLVMTSSNLSGLPIQYEENELEKLSQVCDFYLTHNRPIYLPLDDSVVQLENSETRYIRRARGFVPEPFPTKRDVDQVIALGGQQKNTFAIGKQNHIWVGPHIGDIENEEMIQSFENQLEHFKGWLDLDLEVLAVDKHPQYSTSFLAEKMNCPVISVQHHHAHHVSCMEDNNLTSPTLGLILDGTGYGEDSHIWGFEFLYGDASSFERAAHLTYTPLPGGEKCVKEPWRIATGMILHYWPNDGKEIAERLFPGKQKELSIIEQMVFRGINSPQAGSCGRLFDAVSAILGVCHTSTYEGEAAVKLSDYIMQLPENEAIAHPYPYRLHEDKAGLLELDFSPMIQQIIEDKLTSTPKMKIIQRFHSTIVKSCVDTVLILFEKRPEWNRSVVLSGGSFQNLFLAREIKNQLQKQKVKVYTHKKVPCNDGGLSLGQLIIAATKWNGS
ncbi:carbamoyltransferase HypF [Halalkalibacillus sediminis]|uniref:Carbamoyltransferase n=1 Tax=Halalkalibacillus sediminis TaxID=2018042 RepID=A0A2I0QRL8_9BACI|nr:carbamoyltransferase HypF [Halalkalibacillus sediminis]PKR76978.1 carbamoyltransferase HypF [Halalkalibacillus sediminis]